LPPAGRLGRRPPHHPRKRNREKEISDADRRGGPPRSVQSTNSINALFDRGCLRHRPRSCATGSAAPAPPPPDRVKPRQTGVWQDRRGLCSAAAAARSITAGQRVERPGRALRGKGGCGLGARSRSVDDVAAALVFSTKKTTRRRFGARVVTGYLYRASADAGTPATIGAGTTPAQCCSQSATQLKVRRTMRWRPSSKTS
jgi:hypothetical protein